MNIKKAYDLLSSLHEQSGDHVNWRQLRESVFRDVDKYDSFKKWTEDLYRRTNISDDEKQIMQDMDASVELMFALVKNNKG